MPSRFQAFWFVGAGLLLALVAGGCSRLAVSTPQPSAPPPVSSQPEPTPPPQHPVEVPFVPAPAKPTPPPAKPDETRNLTPPALVGMSEDEVFQLLGQASTRREEPPATIWEYRSRDCALNLFFYMDMESKRFRALAYDVSTTDGAKGDRALSLCLKQIMDQRRD